MQPPATLTVNVTRADILAGIPGDGCLCPIANAVMRIEGVEHADVSIDDMNVTFQAADCEFATGPSSIYVLPDDARHFVRAFDDPVVHGPYSFHPFIFTATIQE